MKSHFRRFAFVASFVFLAYSGWRIFVHGIFETPSFDAPHLDAGAGGLGLLIQALLATVSLLACSIWAFVDSNRWLKLSALTFAASAPLIFILTARGLQRFAPGYSDEAFSALEEMVASGHPLHTSDVVAKLGEPLIVAAASDTSNGEVRWLYSYMPACGFGWDKKYVWSDRNGMVTRIYTMEEP